MTATMTVRELITAVRDDLAKIPVKVESITDVGIPVHNAVQRLTAAIKAMEAAEEAKKAEAEKAGADNEQQT
jgi:hypothetical protein